jgi:TonB family protein
MSERMISFLCGLASFIVAAAFSPVKLSAQPTQDYQTSYPFLSLEVEKKAIARVQQVMASDLDSELHIMPFATWLKEVAGHGTEVIWQLSECGGVTSTPTDIRACVEANIMLLDGRRVILAVAVGTFKRGIDGAPAFLFGVIEKDGEFLLIRRLRDLQKKLLAPGSLASKPLVKLPEASISKVSLSANDAHVGLGPAWGADAFGQVIEAPPPAPPPAGPALLEATSDVETYDASKGSGRPPAGGGAKLSGSVLLGDVIKKSQPRYPAQVRWANAVGAVNVQITVSETGRVIKAKATSGHLLLRKDAVEAALQWVFKPATLNGYPVKVERVLVFVFRASE